MPRQQARQALRQVAQDPLLADRPASLLVMLFSALNRTGVEQLQLAVEALLTGSAADWERLAARPGETAPILRPAKLPADDASDAPHAGNAGVPPEGGAGPRLHSSEPPGIEQ